MSAKAGSCRRGPRGSGSLLGNCSTRCRKMTMSLWMNTSPSTTYSVMKLEANQHMTIIRSTDSHATHL